VAVSLSAMQEVGQWYITSFYYLTPRTLLLIRFFLAVRSKFKNAVSVQAKIAVLFVLTRGLEALLKRKLGKYAGKMLTDKRRIELRRHFDSFIKHQFNPMDPDCEDEYEMTFAGAADIPDIGLEAGYLKVRKFAHFSR
jgi:hypothetical protein